MYRLKVLHTNKIFFTILSLARSYLFLLDVQQTRNYIGVALAINYYLVRKKIQIFYLINLCIFYIELFL